MVAESRGNGGTSQSINYVLRRCRGFDGTSREWIDVVAGAEKRVGASRQRVNPYCLIFMGEQTKGQSLLFDIYGIGAVQAEEDEVGLYQTVRIAPLGLPTPSVCLKSRDLTSSDRLHRQ